MAGRGNESKNMGICRKTAYNGGKSRKLAMLAGVPLALARNMPGAGPAYQC